MSKETTFFQYGILIAFLQHIYDGDITVEELAKYGDFGIGTFNQVDGELIALDGEYYRIDYTGEATIVDKQAMTPFAMVTFFKPEIIAEINQLPNYQTLQKKLKDMLPSFNHSYALSIEGTFSFLHVRAEKPQPRPYRDLADTMPSLQTEFKLKDVTGTLVGFYFPDYLSALNIPGFHFHFIDTERKRGGHLLELQINKATVEIQGSHQFEVKLPKTKSFDEAKFVLNIEQATHIAEKGKRDP